MRTCSFDLARLKQNIGDDLERPVVRVRDLDRDRVLLVQIRWRIVRQRNLDRVWAVADAGCTIIRASPQRRDRLETHTTLASVPGSLRSGSGTNVGGSYGASHRRAATHPRRVLVGDMGSSIHQLPSFSVRVSFEIYNAIVETSEPPSRKQCTTHRQGPRQFRRDAPSEHDRAPRCPPKVRKHLVRHVVVWRREGEVSKINSLHLWYLFNWLAVSAVLMIVVLVPSLVFIYFRRLARVVVHHNRSRIVSLPERDREALEREQREVRVRRCGDCELEERTLADFHFG